MIIEYDKSPNTTIEQRLNSLTASIMRAFEAIEPVSVTIEKNTSNTPSEPPEPIEPEQDIKEIIIECMYPIGSVITSASSEFDPNAIYTNQQWERFAKGKTLVGVDENDEDFQTVEKAGGEKKHKLIIDELPSHTHSATLEVTADKLASGSTYSRLNDNGTATSGIVNIGYTGKDVAHNNLQPFITVYYWKRVA